MMENPKNRKWKVLTSEYLARKPWFTVRHESLELPDGRRIPDYYVFEYPDWINVTAVTRDGRFVLIDQYRHGLGETSYEIPAGVTEPSDASPLDAAQRELMEETGYGGGRIFAPRAAVGQRLVHTRPTHGVGGRENDLRAVFHFGFRRRGLSGRRTSAACRHQQRRTGNQFRFHLSQNLVVSQRI